MNEIREEDKKKSTERFRYILQLNIGTLFFYLMSYEFTRVKLKKGDRRKNMIILNNIRIFHNWRELNYA